METERGGDRPVNSTHALLWGAVILELVSPIPMVLTFGAIYVLLVRPPWFLDMIQDLYRG
jgi:hypothetical protein